MGFLKEIKNIFVIFICSMGVVCSSAEVDDQNGSLDSKDGPMVVLSREAAIFGLLQKYDVMINDKKISEISNNSYIKCKMKPGRYKFSVRPGGPTVIASIDVEIDRENVYLEYVFPVGILVNTFFIGSKIEKRSKDEMLKILSEAKPMGDGRLIDLSSSLVSSVPVEEEGLMGVLSGIHSNSKYPASGFASLEDVMALPYSSSENCRKTYKEWLARKPPRAFAVGVQKGCAFAQGIHPPTPGDSQVPAERVLAVCERTHGPCKLYAVDDRVVYVSTEKDAASKSNDEEAVSAESTVGDIHSVDKYPPTGFAELSDHAAIPLVNSERCRDNYKNWLLQKNPRAFAVGSNKGCGFSWGLEPKTPGDSAIPAERVISACERVSGNGKCVLYAVDDRVVYKKPD